MPVTHALWEEVQGNEQVPGVVFLARHCLEALGPGEPQAAAEALSKMHSARALIKGEPL